MNNTEYAAYEAGNDYSDVIADVAFGAYNGQVKIEDWGSGYGTISITNRVDFEAFVRGLRRAADAAFGESEF